MVKARKGKTIILGLSEENIKRLQQKQPIKFNLRDLIPDGDEYTVYIVAGKTELSIAMSLDKLMKSVN